MMIDIEKMRDEAQERIELRQKFNRALVLEEDEKNSNKEQNINGKKRRDSLFSGSNQDMLSQKAMLVVMQYFARAFADVFHSTKDIVSEIFGKRETMTENSPLAITYDKTLSILQELERQEAIGKKLDAQILNDEFLREKIRDINPARFEENLKTLEEFLHKAKDRENYDINDYFFEVWENEQRLREAQKDVIDAEIVNDDNKEKNSQGKEHSENKQSQERSENKQSQANKQQNVRRNRK